MNGRRDQYKSLGGSGHGSGRRRKEAQNLAKSKREALLRTKRFRIAEGGGVGGAPAAGAA